MEERPPKPRQKYPQARYEVNQSPLYGLRSRRKLAELLLLTLPDMLHMLRAADTNLYRIAPIFKKGLPVLTKDGWQRLAEVPKVLLSRVHQRVLNLLSRIRVPSYIHGSVKKRSYVTNAATHLALGNVVTLDLKRFYPSVKLRHVHAGLMNTFRCSTDVAFCIAKLCTYHCHIPTGSCASARLAYYAHKELFESFHKDALSRGLTLTLYGDDLTTSGQSGVTEFTQQVKTTLRRADSDYRDCGRFASTHSK